MTNARGILIAGLVALTATGAHALYRFWPVTSGAEIAVPAAVYRQEQPVGAVQVRLSMARIVLDVPHDAPAPDEPFESLRRIGGWWTTGGGARAHARALRGRTLYVQVAPVGPASPDAPLRMRPVTISDAPIADATNVAGLVVRVREDGYLWLDFSLGWMRVPAAVEAQARRLSDLERAANRTTPAPPDADADTWAVLRVLPSGRFALASVIVSGVRH